MIHDRRKRWHTVTAALLSISIVACLDVLTNSLDIHRFSWDFRYYIGMAQTGLNPPLASPFAYRYVTPLLVNALSRLAGVSVEQGFRAVAYAGAFLQLFGLFLFTRWLTRSTRGAFVALLVTAFSLFNVKFLLFDIFRPDHLAYAFILLQVYFALQHRFWPLLLSTLIASQIREFNIIPLLAYVVALVLAGRADPSSPARRELRATILISCAALMAALVIPRLVIPVAEDYQFVSLTRDGLLRALIAPLVLPRDANFVYSLVAYVLPILMIAGMGEIRRAVDALSGSTRSYMLVYSGLVLVFSFFGGTDFYRFATYLFVPQAVLLALIVERSRLVPVAVMLAAVLLFNRIWLPFPMSDTGTYLDFYGGFGTRFDLASALRVLECLAFIALGQLLRTRMPPAPVGPSPTS